MNKKWIAALAAVMVAFCVGCKAEIPDYLVVEGTTVTGYTDDLPANLVIPKGITKIAGGAFYECEWLESVVIPGSVKVIGEDITNEEVMEKRLDYEYVLVFYGCTSLKHVTIGKGVKTIGLGAFGGCKSLESVVIPDSVTTIGDLAFGGCTSLESVVIPNSVTKIGGGAFSDCESLVSVVIPDSVTTIGDGAFYDCKSLESIVIPNSVTTIGDNAFSGCKSLESVVIPNSVTTIGDSAFSGCKSLSSVVIPDSVKTIGWYAFSDCESRESVVIPNSVTSIGNGAFYDCKSLKEIRYSGTEAQWETVKKGDDWNHKTLASCVKCTDGEVPLPSCSVKDGVLERWYRAGTEAVIPDGVTTIGENTFDDCHSLVSVTIPSSVTTIGYRAFSDCYSLKEIRYSGTTAQFMNIQGLNTMSLNSGVLIHCTDGELIVQ